MASLHFHPADDGPARELPVSAATSLLVAIMKSGAPVRHDCGGKALCGTCRLSVDPGEALSPLREKERLRLESLSLPLDGSVRLACQATAFRDLEARGLLGPEAGRNGRRAP